MVHQDTLTKNTFDAFNIFTLQMISNNILINCNCRSKDDAALSVGETMKKIIVPHPALQGFNRVQITYTAYKGWLSNGLSKWSIDKFILTDSYGNR